jgi:hypothetical protein
MLGVGLMGGASYVNSYRLILEDNNIKTTEKELAVGLSNFLKFSRHA